MSIIPYEIAEIQKIPYEIFEIEIIQHLDSVSLMRLMVTCKRFLSYIGSSEIWKKFIISNKYDNLRFILKLIDNNDIFKYTFKIQPYYGDYYYTYLLQKWDFDHWLINVYKLLTSSEKNIYHLGILSNYFYNYESFNKTVLKLRKLNWFSLDPKISNNYFANYQPDHKNTLYLTEAKLELVKNLYINFENYSEYGIIINMNNLYSSTDKIINDYVHEEHLDLYSYNIFGKIQTNYYSKIIFSYFMVTPENSLIYYPDKCSGLINCKAVNCGPCKKTKDKLTYGIAPVHIFKIRERSIICDHMGYDKYVYGLYNTENLDFILNLVLNRLKIKDLTINDLKEIIINYATT